jgi:hypothetical protein
MSDLSKDLASQINEQHRLAYGKAQDALEHARRAGELLLQAKESIEHGKWLPWLEANIDVGDRQARSYMMVAKNWGAISAKLEVTSNLSLAGALDAVKNTQAYESPKSSATRDLPAPKPRAVPDILAPSKDDVSQLKAELEETRERMAEMASQQDELLAENIVLQKVEESNDPLKTALAEAKKFREMNRILEERIRGLQNEKNEAIRQAKMWQRKYEQATKAAA